MHKLKKDLPELKKFNNRVKRSFGMGRISETRYKVILNWLEELYKLFELSEDELNAKTKTEISIPSDE